MAPTPHRRRTPASYELLILPKSVKGKKTPEPLLDNLGNQSGETPTGRRRPRSRWQDPNVLPGATTRLNHQGPQRRLLPPAPPLLTARSGARSPGPPGAPLPGAGARGAGRRTRRPGNAALLTRFGEGGADSPGQGKHSPIGRAAGRPSRS